MSGSRNNFKNIYNISVDYTPNLLNEEIFVENIISENMTFSKTKVFPLETLGNKIFVTVNGRDSSDKQVYAEALLELNYKTNIFKMIGYTINRSDYKIGLVIFFVLISIILYLGYRVLKRRRRKNEAQT